MKRFMTYVFVGAMVLNSVPLTAQEEDHEYIDVSYTIKKIAERSLVEVAQISDVELEDGIFDIEINHAESNLFLIIPVGLAAGAGISTLIWGTPVVAGGTILSTALAKGTAVNVASTALWTTSSSMTLGGGNIILTSTLEDIPYGAVRVPFRSFYRAELHYIISPDRPTLSENANEGSCLLFFSVNKDELTLDYEIDNCTHKDVFPETEVGTMRVGNRPDWLDEQFGQTRVVAKGSVSLIDG